jgi:hypothetical protein
MTIEPGLSSQLNPHGDSALHWDEEISATTFKHLIIQANSRSDALLDLFLRQFQAWQTCPEAPGNPMQAVTIRKAHEHEYDEVARIWMESWVSVAPGNCERLEPSCRRRCGANRGDARIPPA